MHLDKQDNMSHLYSYVLGLGNDYYHIQHPTWLSQTPVCGLDIAVRHWGMMETCPGKWTARQPCYYAHTIDYIEKPHNSLSYHTGNCTIGYWVYHMGREVWNRPMCHYVTCNCADGCGWRPTSLGADSGWNPSNVYALKLVWFSWLYYSRLYHSWISYSHSLQKHCLHQEGVKAHGLTVMVFLCSCHPPGSVLSAFSLFTIYPAACGFCSLSQVYLSHTSLSKACWSTCSLGKVSIRGSVKMNRVDLRQHLNSHLSWECLEIGGD